MHPLHELVPVTILTGFLGSGKTTLLSSLVRRPRWPTPPSSLTSLAIGLDHALVEYTDGNLIELESGCICYTVQSGKTVQVDSLGRGVRSNSKQNAHSIARRTKYSICARRCRAVH